MKKTIIPIFLLLAFFAIMISSCNKDVEKPITDTPVKKDSLIKREDVSKKDTTVKIEAVSDNSALEGVWVSLDDSKSTLEIKGNDWTDKYVGEKSFSSKFAIGDSCLSDKNAKTNTKGKYITVFDGSDKFCYYIIDVSDAKLNLSYVGRGNTLSYKKKK